MKKMLAGIAMTSVHKQLIRWNLIKMVQSDSHPTLAIRVKMLTKLSYQVLRIYRPLILTVLDAPVPLEKRISSFRALTISSL